MTVQTDTDHHVQTAEDNLLAAAALAAKGYHEGATSLATIANAHALLALVLALRPEREQR
jgi:hypothetical protein